MGATPLRALSEYTQAAGFGVAAIDVPESEAGHGGGIASRGGLPTRLFRRCRLVRTQTCYVEFHLQCPCQCQCQWHSSSPYISRCLFYVPVVVFLALSLTSDYDRRYDRGKGSSTRFRTSIGVVTAERGREGSISTTRSLVVGPSPGRILSGTSRPPFHRHQRRHNHNQWGEASRRRHDDGHGP